MADMRILVSNPESVWPLDFADPGQVYGRHHQQQPQARQLRRLLQRHTVRRRSDHLAFRWDEQPSALYEPVCFMLGFARWQLDHCAPGHDSKD